MGAPLYTTKYAEDVLAQIINITDGVLLNAKLKLFTNSKNPDKADVPGDYTEATFDGYAAKTITWEALQNQGDYRILSAGLQTWTANGDTVSETIHGWFLTSNDDADLLAAQAFDTTVPVSKSGDSVKSLPSLKM